MYWSDSTNAVTTGNGILVANGASTTFNHTGLVNFTDYSYIVTATNTTGEGASSPVVGAQPLATLDPCPGGLDLSPSVNGNPVDCNQPPGSLITYSLTNTSGGTLVYRIMVYNKPPSTGDVDIFVEDAGTPIVESYFFNPYRDEVVFSMPDGTTYDVIVNEWFGNPADYFLEVTSSPAPGSPAGSVATECNDLNLSGDACGGGALYRIEGFNGDSGVMLVSTEIETDSIAYKTTATPTLNARDQQDGRNNVGTMNADHPASAYCQAFTQNGFSDWYLPASWELHHLKFAENLGQVVGISNGPPVSFYFWSSTENPVDPTQAREVKFDGLTTATFINWIKTDASTADLLTCVRRPIL